MLDTLPRSNAAPPSIRSKSGAKRSELMNRLDMLLELQMKQVEAFAVLAIRNLELVAAGGIAATLGLFSSDYERLSTTAGALPRVNLIIAPLCSSLLATLICARAGYFSQVLFAGSIARSD